MYQRDGRQSPVRATTAFWILLFGIPWYVDTRLIFYRTDILRRAGYQTPPSTWAEWRTAMERIKANAGPGQYALFLPTNEWPQPVILALQAGSTLLADGGRRGAFSAAEFRRAFDFYTGLFTDSLAPPISNNQISNIYQEFAAGNFAMIITGPWRINQMAQPTMASNMASRTSDFPNDHPAILMAVPHPCRA